MASFTDEDSELCADKLHVAANFHDAANFYEVDDLRETASTHSQFDARVELIENRAVESEIAQYHLLDKIGGGAMTAVYRAQDTVLDRLVALKMLLSGADETTRERFRREARTAAMLEHPNIVRIYQVGQMPDSGLPFIAMEIVNGPSLAQYLEKRSVISPAEAAALLEPIARALAYAHSRGVVHRDVKPSNILMQRVAKEHPLRIEIVTGDDSKEKGAVAPLLSDFGIAWALDAPELTNEGRTIGTPAYMSPEQCAGADELDGRSDIYALGAVYYRCIVGRPPYAGSTTQILHAHVYDPLLIPRDSLVQLPLQAVEILKKSMSKNPRDRYGSALELADDFAKMASQQSLGNTGTSGHPKQSTFGLMPAVGATTPSYVLVPAQAESTHTEPSDTVAESSAPLANATSDAAIDSSGGYGKSSRNGGAILALALLALTVLMIVALFSVVWPSLRASNQNEPVDEGLVSGTPFAGGVNTDVPVTPQLQSELVANPTPETSPSVSVAAVQSPPAVQVSTATPTTTLTSAAPLEVSPEFAWNNAQIFYEEQDWDEALTWLIALQRSEPSFEKDTVSDMLTDTYVALAEREIEEGQFEKAKLHLQKTVDAAIGGEALNALYEAVEGVVDAKATVTPEDTRAIQRAIVSYAAYLSDEGRYCAAVDQIEFARTLIVNSQLNSVLQECVVACEQLKLDNVLSTLTGRIVFSSLESDRYNIFEVDVDTDASPRLLIRDGSQPAVSPDEQRIAFYGRKPDSQGLVGAPFRPQSADDDGRVKYTDYVEDARDSPPSWNPQGDRLAYGSTNFGDGRSRIYLTWADGTRNTVELGLGKDPAWHPTEDLIVYNGTDETGNNPGLWLMRTDGSDRVRLTDNGNDQRPAWLPDGSGIVFMSSGRDGNWELYRYDMDDGQVSRLTDFFAQDGLPTISPYGQYVAFLSDRDGYWRLWFVPVEGGDAYPLANIAGELPKWLEHSIQWVR